MRDTDFYRYTRDGLESRETYRSIKNVEAGIRYSRGVDIKYEGKWFYENGIDKFGPDHDYKIQKLVAVYAYPPYLEWQNLEDIMEY